MTQRPHLPAGHVPGSVVLLLLALFAATCRVGTLGEGVTPSEAIELREEVREMFYHAFNGYVQHAFPLDELRPLTCTGEDSLGGYALTLIDSLDTLALLGDKERFASGIEWIGKNLRFDINKTVSVFETTIRVLGGLLSAHLIARDYATGMRIQLYDDQLLHLAEDLAQRLLPAFDTPTGIPFGSVNLMHGVDENENKITSTAGGGTLTLEFGILSRLTNNPIYDQVTKKAVHGIWARRSGINLVGAHINVFTGEWTQKDAGIGTSIDSFYEYLLKAYLLFGDEEYLFMFQEAYKAAMHYLYHDPWYVEVNMDSAATVWPLFNSLQAFWPGLQVLAGDVDPAIRTHAAFFSVWKKYGFTPEGFNLATFSVQFGQRSYPLRPELIESTYWLYKATRDPWYLDVGRDMVASLQYGARCTCGYCHIADVESHKQEDHMESFFLAETVKYLWLLFELAAGPDNIVENGPYKYIFSTEGHLFPASPEISLVNEHCSYFGAPCKNERRKSLGTSGVSHGHQEVNNTRFHNQACSGFQTSFQCQAYGSVQSNMKYREFIYESGFIKASTCTLVSYNFTCRQCVSIRFMLLLLSRINLMNKAHNHQLEPFWEGINTEISEVNNRILSYSQLPLPLPPPPLSLSLPPTLLKILVHRTRVLKGRIHQASVLRGTGHLSKGHQAERPTLFLWGLWQVLFSVGGLILSVRGYLLLLSEVKIYVVRGG